MREKKRNSRYSIRLKLQIVYMALLILTAVTMFTFLRSVFSGLTGSRRIPTWRT